MVKETNQISTVRVHFSSRVSSSDIDLRLVDETGHHVRLAVEEQLHALDGTLGHDAGAVTLLSAVRNDLTLGVGDVVQCRRTPEAEV